MREKVIMRETYDVLTFVGDVGGLLDGLLILGNLFLWPYTTFKLRSYLLSSLFRRMPLNIHGNEDPDKEPG